MRLSSEGVELSQIATEVCVCSAFHLVKWTKQREAGRSGQTMTAQTTQKFIGTPWRTLLENTDSVLLFFQLCCCLNTGNYFSWLTMDTTSVNCTVLCVIILTVCFNLALCMFMNGHSDCADQCHAEIFCFLFFFLSYFSKKNNKTHSTYLRGKERNSSVLWILVISSQRENSWQSWWSWISGARRNTSVKSRGNLSKMKEPEGPEHSQWLRLTAVMSLNCWENSGTCRAEWKWKPQRLPRILLPM